MRAVPWAGRSPVAKIWMMLGNNAGLSGVFGLLSWFKTPPAKMPGATAATSAVKTALVSPPAVTVTRVVGPARSAGACTLI